MIEYHWRGRRYNVNAGTYGNYTDLHPIYGDKCTIKHSMPDEERYYKESFNGTLKFVRDDYTWIMSTINSVTRFNTVYELELWTQTQKVTTLKFVITDCDIDEDNGIISVKPTTKTRYDELLAGLDREFNLVDLNPVIKRVQWSKRAILQFTEEDSPVVTNCLGGITWEQDKTDASGSLITDFKFGLSDMFLVATITDIGEGTYYGRSEPVGETMRDFDIQRGVTNPTSPYGYKLRFFETSQEIGGQTVYYYTVELYRSPFPSSTNYTLYATALGNGRLPNSANNVNLYNTNSQYVCQISWTTSKLYARILLDNLVAGAQARPTDDIVDDENKYRYVMPYTDNLATITNAASTTPTPYGPFTSYLFNGYYAPPAEVGYLPVLQSYWTVGISTWVDLSLVPDLNLMSRGMVLRHAYPLYSAIKVLLAQIAPDINFDESTDYSEFLFSATNPLTSDDMVHLFITPKTNILNGDYKTPAYNAPIKLKDIFDMLKAVYKCYWFIDTDNNLRIEHVSWFMNGGTYSDPSQTISYDLTTLKNSRNMKAWAYDKNQYTFDKPNMPATYTFAWMDDVSQEFKGYQMEMMSMLVEKDKNEEVNVAKFTSDIDFVVISPTDISKDGFVILGAMYFKEQYIVPLYSLTLPGTSIINYLQNGYLAYIYLEKNEIWLSNMPAPTVQYADGSSKSVYTQSRMKQQDVVVPMTSPIFDPITLIRTGLGDGEIQDIEINLSSLTGKVKLKYDTQQ